MILAAGEEASRQVTTNGVAPGHHETYGATSRAPIVPLVTGCGRAGTHTVAEVLNSFGIPAIHEGAARDSVAVSWFYAPRTSVEGFADATISDEEGNAIKLKHVDKRPLSLQKSGCRFTPIIHITRDPLTHIEATSRCICARGTDLNNLRAALWNEASWSYAGRHIDLRGTSAGVLRSAKYWLHWNEMIEEFAKAQFRIEDLNRKFTHVTL